MAIFGFSALPLVGIAIVAAIGMAYGNIHFPANGTPPPKHTFTHNFYYAFAWIMIADIIIIGSLGAIWSDNKSDPSTLLGLAVSSLGLVGMFLLFNHWAR
jgi:hypothetical protein